MREVDGMKEEERIQLLTEALEEARSRWDFALCEELEIRLNRDSD